MTRTAQHLALTQGAVSHSLRKLRTLFGDTLFIRSKTGLIPTQRGQELAEPVAQFLMQGEQLLLTHSDFDPGGSQRVINLCMNDVGDIAIVPTLLQQLRQNAPGCVVNTVPLGAETAAQSLESGAFDMVVSGHALSGADVMRQKLYTHRIAVMVSSRSPLPDRISLAQFCTLDHIAVPYTPNAPVPVDQFLEHRGLKRRVVATTTHGAVLPYWIESDPTLVATMPFFLAKLHADRGGFRLVEVDEWLPPFEIFQYWHRRYDSDRFNIWLRNTLRHAVARHDLS